MCHQRYRAHPRHRMYIFRVIISIFMVVAPDYKSLSLKDNSVKNTNSILTIAQTTLYHIKQVKTQLAMTPQADVASPSVKGLSSIIHALGLMENELQTLPTAHLSQIMMDVSSLEGRLRSLALTLNCPIQDKPTAKTRAHLFPDSTLRHTLTRLENYLEMFIDNKDQLMVC